MLLVYALAIVISSLAEATVTVGGEDCPQQFHGEVESIRNIHAHGTAFATEKVTFRNSEALRGDLPESVQVELVSGGPFKLIEGREYRVYLRKGKLCWLEEI